MTQQPWLMVVGYMQAMMALISPSSRFFNKSFLEKAAWISLWDLWAHRGTTLWNIKGQLRTARTLNKFSSVGAPLEKNYKIQYLCVLRQWALNTPERCSRLREMFKAEKNVFLLLVSVTASVWDQGHSHRVQSEGLRYDSFSFGCLLVFTLGWTSYRHNA